MTSDDNPYPSVIMWVEMDSNHRRLMPTDLQSARFNHLPTYPDRLSNAMKA